MSSNDHRYHYVREDLVECDRLIRRTTWVLLAVATVTVACGLAAVFMFAQWYRDEQGDIALLIACMNAASFAFGCMRTRDHAALLRRLLHTRVIVRELLAASENDGP